MKQKVRMRRLAKVDESACVACGCCVKVCPRDAIAVFGGCYAVVDAPKCVGCGKCAIACPAAVIDMVEGAR